MAPDPPTDNDLDLDRLMIQALDGEASEADLATLEMRLASDPLAAQAFSQLSDTHGTLTGLNSPARTALADEEALSSGLDLDRVLSASRNRHSAEQQEPASAGSKVVAFPNQKLVTVFLAAAAAVTVAVIMINPNSGSPPSLASSPSGLGFFLPVAGEVSFVQSGTTVPAPPGQSLGAGELQGIKLADGAKALVVMPGETTVLEGAQIQLYIDGKLTEISEQELASGKFSTQPAPSTQGSPNTFLSKLFSATSPALATVLVGDSYRSGTTTPPTETRVYAPADGTTLRTAHPVFIWSGAEEPVDLRLTWNDPAAPGQQLSRAEFTGIGSPFFPPPSLAVPPGTLVTASLATADGTALADWAFVMGTPSADTPVGPDTPPAELILRASQRITPARARDRDFGQAIALLLLLPDEWVDDPLVIRLKAAAFANLGFAEEAALELDRLGQLETGEKK